ncbi:hypothetical protein chiPu_0008805 [Chiloscyllium punctatum]|uniref:Uncharacterized protein n=1 Tax=Chiloscyllium punctatum TaxID=137246 RepID=A0A401SIW4_CHIPU|nr:hypothetical protein [Chiloscyllium punctatum]
MRSKISIEDQRERQWQGGIGFIEFGIRLDVQCETAAGGLTPRTVGEFPILAQALKAKPGAWIKAARDPRSEPNSVMEASLISSVTLKAGEIEPAWGKHARAEGVEPL